MSKRIQRSKTSDRSANQLNTNQNRPDSSSLLSHPLPRIAFRTAAVLALTVAATPIAISTLQAGPRSHPSEPVPTHEGASTPNISQTVTAAEDSSPDTTATPNLASDEPASDEPESDEAVPPSEAPSRSSSIGAALRTLRDQLERQERPLGSRGPQCPYSPGLVGANDTIWSDRPLFLWRSTGQTVSVYDYNSGNLIWQRQVEAGTEAVVYDGEPLLPGGLYRWALTHPDASDFNATFTIMQEDERTALKEELIQAEATWSAAGLSPDQLAVERATFFGDKRLWSDALQELYAIRDSAEVEAMVQDISVYLCGAIESDTPAIESSNPELNSSRS